MVLISQEPHSLAPQWMGVESPVAPKLLQLWEQELHPWVLSPPCFYICRGVTPRLDTAKSSPNQGAEQRLLDAAITPHSVQRTTNITYCLQQWHLSHRFKPHFAGRI